MYAMAKKEKKSPGRIGGVTAAPTRGKGSRKLKLSTAAIFTEELQSQPGDWFHFASTRVEKARYDYGLRQIQVVFVKGGTPWVYEECPPEVFRRFTVSSSAGAFVDRELNRYPYRSAYGEGWS